MKSSNKGKGLVLANPQITKREIKALVNSYDLEQLGKSPAESYALLMRLEELTKGLKGIIKEAILNNWDSDDNSLMVEGGELSLQGGGVSFTGEKSFGHWQVWKDANERIKEIQGLMKSAWKHPGTVMVDQETGEEVPAARPITRSAFLKYNF